LRNAADTTRREHAASLTADPAHTAPVIGWVLRMLLFRVLPRKIMPLITLVELLMLVRAIRRRRFAVNDPTASRTALPAPWPGRPRVR
jgi:hypothetical protein